MGRFPDGSDALLEFCATMLFPVSNETFTAGKLGGEFESIAAALRTLSPAAGEPVKYGLGPALPAAATTMTPASAACSDASASAASSGPKSAPGAMLITCRSG